MTCFLGQILNLRMIYFLTWREYATTWTWLLVTHKLGSAWSAWIGPNKSGHLGQLFIFAVYIAPGHLFFFLPTPEFMILGSPDQRLISGPTNQRATMVPGARFRTAALLYFYFWKCFFSTIFSRKL